MAWATLADVTTKAVLRSFKTASAASYVPTATGVAESIDAIFDAAFETFDTDADQPMIVTRPMIDIRLADLSVAPAQGDAVTVSGVVYEVTEIQPQPSGLAARLFLTTGI